MEEKNKKLGRGILFRKNIATLLTFLLIVSLLPSNVGYALTVLMDESPREFTDEQQSEEEKVSEKEKSNDELGEESESPKEELPSHTLEDSELGSDQQSEIETDDLISEDAERSADGGTEKSVPSAAPANSESTKEGVGEEQNRLKKEPLVINTSSDGQKIGTDNLRDILEENFDTEVIAATATLEITGSQSNLSLGSEYGLTDSVAYLNELGITTLDLSGFTGTLGSWSFRGLNVEMVALGQNVTSLPTGAFAYCSSLSAISDTVAHASASLTNLVDIAKTGITSFAAGGYQFYSANSIEALTLPDEIDNLPMRIFGYCVSLSTISDTETRAVGSSWGVVDLDQTKVTSLNFGGYQFEGCDSLTTVTLDSSITMLPAGIFTRCASLITLSDTLFHANNGSRGVIDLDKTGITSLEAGGEQFAHCRSIKVVALGSSIRSLPGWAFGSCTSLTTISDTAQNAQSESAGFIDFKKLPGLSFPSGSGNQFVQALSAIAHVGLEGMDFPVNALGYTSVFVPKTVSSVTFSGHQASVSRFYVSASSTTVANLANVPSEALVYYCDVEASAGANGSISVNKSATPAAFLPEIIENHERAVGSLERGHTYALASQNIACTITPASGYVVKQISINGAKVTPVSVKGHTYVLAGVTQDSKIYVTFAQKKTVTEHYVDRWGKVIAPDTAVSVFKGDSYARSLAPSVKSYLYTGASYAAPSPSSPSLVSNKNLPRIPSVDANSHVWYVFGEDKISGVNSAMLKSNGIEDYALSLTWVDMVSKPISPSLSAQTVRYDVTETFALPYTCKGSIPTGWTYAGYRVNNGALVRIASHPSFLVGISALRAQSVQYVFTRSSYSVRVEHIDSEGNPIGSANMTTQIMHDKKFSYSAPQITGYDYAYWVLDGAYQNTENPVISSVTSTRTVKVVYTAQVDEGEEKEGNYQFIKKPNSKRVIPGEVVSYSFKGMANSFGTTVERYSLADKPDKGLDFVSASLPAFAHASGVTYDVVYYSSMNGRTTLHTGVSAAKPFEVVAPELEEGEYITAIAFNFGLVPAGFGVGNEVVMSFKVWDKPPALDLTNIGILSYRINGIEHEYSSGLEGETTIFLDGYILAETSDTIPLVTLVISLIFTTAIVAFARRIQKNFKN